MSTLTMDFSNTIAVPESATVYGKLVEKNYCIAFRDTYSTSIFQNRNLRSFVQFAFETLKKKWLEEIEFASDIETIVNNRNYRFIAGLGWEVVPLIINELKVTPHYWFVALEQLTGEDPVLPEHYGDMQSMAQDWINWYNNLL